VVHLRIHPIQLLGLLQVGLGLAEQIAGRRDGAHARQFHRGPPLDKVQMRTESCCAAAPSSILDLAEGRLPFDPRGLQQAGRLDHVQRLSSLRKDLFPIPADASPDNAQTVDQDVGVFEPTQMGLDVLRIDRNDRLPAPLDFVPQAQFPIDIRSFEQQVNPHLGRIDQAVRLLVILPRRFEILRRPGGIAVGDQGRRVAIEPQEDEHHHHHQQQEHRRAHQRHLLVQASSRHP